MKLKIIPGFALLLSGGVVTLLMASAADQFLGLWEVDVNATLAQYEKVPAGWESMTLAEYKNHQSEEITGRAYKFTDKRPQKPEWGETNFEGSVEIRRDGKMKFYGAWRTSTNQPDTYELFAYTMNSGASYWRAGEIHIGTNRSEALRYYDPKEKPLVLRKK